MKTVSGFLILLVLGNGFLTGYWVTRKKWLLAINNFLLAAFCLYLLTYAH